MSRTLNGWTLPTNTNWIDRWQHSPARMTIRRTTGGGIAVAGQMLSGGRIITLEWARGRQWLTYSDVQQIESLVNSGVGAVFPLVWDTFSAQVQVDFERGAWNIEQRGWRLDPSADKHYGQLFLFTR